MTPSLLDHHDVRSSFDLLAAWIEGRPVGLDNRHKRLYEQSRARPLPLAARK